ncbi:ATP-binding protein [Stenotrophomonas sp. C1657]|uniref:two-component system sensor histidine kinase NtrB n=1 Tax=Stenotrophomonas sp. C1657 TaxID=3077844 RepID=UPI00293D0CF8|nr:ATP-binding protein [Stenotrophomonas sp. C1657]MDV3514214.1 ATP-binding protein [Stenotrophomonas sp. C1657]
MSSTRHSDGVLTDQSRQLSLLVNSITDYAIYMLDPTGVIRTWNPGGQRIKGYSAADVVNTHFSRFYLPEEAAAGLPQRNLKVAAEEGRYIGEGWRLRQDGSVFRASIVIDPVWDNGQLVGFAKITRDITELYHAQEQLLQAQRDLLQAQKMEAIGKFTLGLAHDFNNLLTIISNCLDMIGAQVKEQPVSSLLATAQRAGDRGALLTRQLLTFGRGQTLVPESVDLATMLGDCEAMLRRSAGDGITLSIELPPGLPRLSVDKAQLEAAILNLVSNSRDALPRGGDIAITASARQARDPAHSERGLSGHVCITVADNGEGIPVDVQARVFEPFFTTKSVGKGSGLGLSQVFGFTSQSGGFTELESEVGKGTRVRLCFPLEEH